MKNNIYNPVVLQTIIIYFFSDRNKLTLIIKGIIRYSFLIILLLLPITCCNSIEPPIDDVKPGRRDYSWMVDTVNYGEYIGQIWASSPTDIWAVGSGDYRYNIWHYDGNGWSTDSVFRNIAPDAIYGFSPNDIYISDGWSGLWKYDGVDWSHFVQLSKDGHTDIAIQNIWGESNNDFYVLGAYPDENLMLNYPVIAHYNGFTWEMLNTNGIIGGIVGYLYKNKPNGSIYIMVVGSKPGEFSDSTYIYEYIKGSFERIYTSAWVKGLQCNISHINGTVYFILGNRIATRFAGKFITMFTVDNNEFYQRIWGRSSKDIFLMMLDGLVHYNGTDMEYLFYYKQWGAHINGAALFEKEVFFLVNQGNLNLIYHGKLN